MHSSRRGVVLVLILLHVQHQQDACPGNSERREFRVQLRNYEPGLELFGISPLAAWGGPLDGSWADIARRPRTCGLLNVGVV